GGGGAMLNVGEGGAPVAPDSVAMNLFLIGDAGLPAPGGEPVLEALKASLAASDTTRNFVVWLGDNIYPHGLVDSTLAEHRENRRILDAQIEVMRATRTRGVFVPGNHDWHAGSPLGYETILRQQRYIDANGAGVAEMLPKGGCPGPVVMDFEGLRVIFIDTQWWLHGDPKPVGALAAHCRARSEQEVIDSLRVDLATAGERRTVVVAHHPLVSGGQHGGYFDWPTYLFPFHPWARIGGAFARQDVSGREYRNLRAAMERAFAADPPLVFAAGHEHNLQILRRSPAEYQIVSGAGIYGHLTAVRAITGTRYTRAASGYVVLSILVDGRVRVSVQVVDAQGRATEDHSSWLETDRFPSVEAADSARRAATVTPGGSE
ncbi:MAG TPA: metallophosphoesterase, partial [Longimicrobium sp.]|nr:metallophosphoesterase [Longimicrobium sp.]